MSMLRIASLTVLLLCVRPAQAQALTVYRCVDAKGAVSLQDDACPAGQQQTKLVRQRPVDAPPRPETPKPAPPATPAPIVVEIASTPATAPPPALYECTSYDGIVRESESYDPNPRCEPIVLYHPRARELPPEWQAACRWVEDSCVRLSDTQACARFVRKQREAKSAIQHAFSDTEAYRKSELARLTQIVERSCR